MEHWSIGLPFQHLYHLLVSALTLSQLQNRQVSYIFSFLLYVPKKVGTLGNCCSWLLTYNILFHPPTCWNKGPSSTISMVYKPDGSTNDTIEVGQGSLKLFYSADEGKLTNYVNSRNMVCYVVDDLVSQCSILFLSM